jgi:hypothetical protein
LDVAEIARRPKSDVENKALASGSFGSRNADPRRDFQLLNMNLLFGANSHFFWSPNISANFFLTDKFRF